MPHLLYPERNRYRRCTSNNSFPCSALHRHAEWAKAIFFLIFGFWRFVHVKNGISRDHLFFSGSMRFHSWNALILSDTKSSRMPNPEMIRRSRCSSHIVFTSPKAFSHSILRVYIHAPLHSVELVLAQLTLFRRLKVEWYRKATFLPS